MHVGRAIVGLFFVVALVALGGLVYQAGVSAGAAGQIAEVGRYVGPMGYGWHGGFGIFGFLGSLFLFFLVIGLFKRLVFGGMFGHRMHGGYWRGQYMGDVPRWEGRAKEIHDEWHRSQRDETSQPGQTPTSTQ